MEKSARFIVLLEDAGQHNPIGGKEPEFSSQYPNELRMF
jgi:hypothetical protein